MPGNRRARRRWSGPARPGAFGDGELERMNRAAQINTFGGGVSEVQREIVATMRLGMTEGAAVTSEAAMSGELGGAAYERLEGVRGPRGRGRRRGQGPGQRADDPALVRGDGRHQPRRTRGPDAVAPPDDAPGVDDGRALRARGPVRRRTTSCSALLDGAGYTSVVATDCEQEYLRPLRPGDRITFDAVIESVSERKTTKLGTGHFVTTRMDVRADGELVGHASLPHPQVRAGAARPKDARGAETGGPRPRPVINRDNAGFWEGVERAPAADPALRRLRDAALPLAARVQRVRLARVGHGRGERRRAPSTRYVVMHHPPFPAFDSPLRGGAGRARGGRADRQQRHRGAVRQGADRHAGRAGIRARATRSWSCRSSGREPPGAVRADMDFTPTEEQAAARDLAAQIFGDLVHPRAARAPLGTGTRRRAVEGAVRGRAAGRRRGRSALLGLVLLLEEQGRTTAQVPFAATCVYGLLAVAAHGTAEQRAAAAARRRGRARRSATGGVARPEAEACTRRPLRGRLDRHVPVRALAAGRHACAGRRRRRRRLWLVRTADAAMRAGARLTAPWSAGRLTLRRDAGRAARRGSAGAVRPVDRHERRARHRTYRLRGLQAGVCEGSLARAAEYTSNREQFGRPLSTNQGVRSGPPTPTSTPRRSGSRAYEAAWRLRRGPADAAQALIAAMVGLRGGQRVVHTGQHLHGGMGADVDYPVHRLLPVGQADRRVPRRCRAPTSLDELGRSCSRRRRLR